MTRGPGIVLIGARAVGKTSVAGELAERLGWPRIELDEWVERAAGMSIAGIFERGGEQRFRSLESAQLATLPRDRKQIVSTGGGSVLADENRRILHALGTVCWLTAEPAVMQARLRADQSLRPTRPSLTGGDPVDEVERVLAARRSIYEELADFVIDTSRLSVAQAATHIIHVTHARPMDVAE